MNAIMSLKMLVCAGASVASIVLLQSCASAPRPRAGAEQGAGAAALAEWPQFLGPLGSGVSPEPVKLARQWPAGGPRECWSFALEKGFGGAAIKAGRVYVNNRVGAQADELHCLDLASGTSLWHCAWPAPGKQPSFPGTRSTPAVDEQFVYTIGPFGQMHCVSLATHTSVWDRDLMAEFKVKVFGWEWSPSPQLYGDWVIVAVRGTNTGVVAFKRATGEVAWQSAPIGVQSHAAPTIAKVFGRDQIVATGDRGVYGLDPGNGALLWTWNGWKGDRAIPSPCSMSGGRFFLTDGYGNGYGIVALATNAAGVFAARTVYTDTNQYGQIPTPIFYQGYIYTSGNANKKSDGLTCLDPDGVIKWRTGKQPNFERGNFIMADGLLIAIDAEKLTLHLIEPSPAAYRELASAKVLKEKQCWGPLAISNGKVLVREQARLVCFDLR